MGDFQEAAVGLLQPRGHYVLCLQVYDCVILAISHQSADSIRLVPCRIPAGQKTDVRRIRRRARIFCDFETLTSFVSSALFDSFYGTGLLSVRVRFGCVCSSSFS